MRLDLATLTFILGLTFITEVVALIVQYRVNKTYRVNKLWILGTALMALGFVFMPLLHMKWLGLLSRIANPLVLLGLMFLNVGTAQFLEQKVTKKPFAIIYAVFLVAYYYYMFIHNDISGRTVTVSVAMAIVALMTAYRLISVKNKSIAGSAYFTALIFLVYGCYFVINAIYLETIPPLQNYSGMRVIPTLAFILPIVTSALWTYGFIIMVNQRLNEENREEREKLQLVFNTSPDAVIITRLEDGLFVEVNESFLNLTGYSRVEVIGHLSRDVKIWQDASDRLLLIQELLDYSNCRNREFVFRRKSGSTFVGEISARLIKIQEVTHIISVVHDITDRKRADEAIRVSEETYRSILDASPDDITITDLEGRIIMTSPAANAMFGYERGEEVGLMLLEFLVPEDRARAKVNILKAFQGGSSGPNEYCALRKDQTEVEIEVNSRIIPDLDGNPLKMVFVIRDISKRKQTEYQIQKLVQQLEVEKHTAELNSITDSLTGLSNRRYFDESLKIEFYRLKRTGMPLSMIMLDIDHFKLFNDSYGHLAGDECLRKIGAVLRDLIGRAADVVARYGGEEFVVILPETDSAGVARMAELIRREIEAIAIPHAASDTSEFVTVSLGVVTVFTTTMETPEDIVVLADQAMYAAKQSGRNQVCVSSSMS